MILEGCTGWSRDTDGTGCSGGDARDVDRE